MHTGKYKPQLAQCWGKMMFCLYVIQYNPVISDGKPLIFLANREERTRPMVSEIGSTLTLTCSMPDSNVNITNDKGQLLNSSIGVVSFVVNSTTCQDAGTYICQAPGVAERHMILFIDGCHPVLCHYKEQDTKVTANLSTDVHISICFLVNKETPQKLLMQYNNRWIRQDSNDDKIKLGVIQNATDLLYNTLSITIRNITIYDYGEVDIALPVTVSQVLKFRIVLSNEGNQAVHIQHTWKENEIDLTCTAYNYPKKVSLRKKSLSQAVSRPISLDNTSIKPHIKLTFPANAFSCSDMGTYACDVTDFQGITRTYEYVLLLVGCSAVLKLCDWQPNFITTKTHIGGKVNLTVCLFNTNENSSLGNIKQIPMNSFTYSFKRTGVYTALELAMPEAREANFRNYTILIENSMNVTVNMIKNTVLSVCQNISEHVILIKPNERAIFGLCVKSNEALNNKILINNVPVSTNETTHQYRVMVATISKEEINITIEILNFTTFSSAMYNVQIFTKSGSTISHNVLFNITETRMGLCTGDHDNVTVPVRLHSPAVVHLCVSSNVGLGEYISIDGVTHQIYGPNRISKYGVSADVIIQDMPNYYYIQIYIRNVTETDIRTHEIMIKPTRYDHETFRFCLKRNSKEYPVGCSTCVPKTYFFAKVRQMCTLNFCVMAKEPIKDGIFLNKVEHKIGDTNQQRSMVIQCSNEATEYNNITKNKIKLQIYVESENFTRYELKVLFGDDAWNHTFYLLDDDNLNNVRCKDGTTEREAKAYIYSNLSFRMRVFGVVDSHLLINNISYPIDPHCKNGKVQVVQYFSINTLICHLVIDINNLTINDFITYNVSLPSMDKIYIFTGVMKKFPLELEFYGEQLERRIDGKSLTKQVTLDSKLIMTCKMHIRFSFPVKLKVTFQSRTLKETNNETNVGLNIERFQCKDVGTYGCVADMDFQHSKVEIILYDSSCDPRWCEPETHTKLDTAAHGRDFILPLCVLSYSDVNFTFILNGRVLSSEQASKFRYDKVGYDNNTSTYRATVTVKNISQEDYGDYNITLIRHGVPNVNLNLSFHIPEIETNKTIGAVIPPIIAALIIVLLVLISTSLFLIITLKRRANSETPNDISAPVNSLHYQNVAEIVRPRQEYVNVHQNEYDLLNPDDTDLNVYTRLQAVLWDDVYISVIDDNDSNEDINMTLFGTERVTINNNN